MKLCSDCKYFQSGGAAVDDLCGHPKAIRSITFVRGEKTIMHCESMRMGTCGQEGALFEPATDKAAA